MVSRRNLLFSTVAVPLIGAPAGGDFDFVHFTDCHLQPELGGISGTRQCFRKISSLKPAFAIAGGDLVMDADAGPKQRAESLYRSYAEVQRELRMPVHAVLGNHDVVGTQPDSGFADEDPDMGKAWFEKQFGRRYRSFDHKGWHFVLLDSIQTDAMRIFSGKIDAEQMRWLQADLAALAPKTPVIVTTHVPLVSAAMQIVPDPWKTASTYLITNAPEVLEVLKPYNVKAVLQGHTHIREKVVYDGVQYLTSGAVCGNWWKGARLGHPEGFAYLQVRGGEVHWRYETYGWTAQA
jgi:3',5'-cyclic AMP phosphodiesterase CpdA